MGASVNDSVDQLHLLSELVDAVAAAADLQEIYERALDGLKAACSIERCAVLLLDENKVARFVASRGLSDEYRSKAEGHFPWPIDTVDPPSLSVTDAMNDPTLTSLYENFRRERIGALAFIPLVYDRQLLGKFMLYHPAPHDFTDKELALAQTIARLIAFAVQRRRIENTLRDVDRRKDEFLATLAHELRNPLGALSAALDVMALHDAGGTERAQAIARRQVLHLARLLDDLLDLSRITRGMVELQKEPVELSAVVARAVEGIRPVLDRMHHELVLAVPTRRLIGDPVRLEQILSNLLGNAAKYTPAGGTITISAANEPETVVLRVRDNGIGMPASLIPHVFDMFAQGERSLDRSQGGLGIGLSITKQLVVRHGGTITAFSAGPGKGSEFVVTLPAPRVMGVESRRTAAIESDGDPNSSGARVLLVDDNEDLASLLAELLRGWGHIVETQATSQAALDAVQHFVPDVILLDIGLPEIDGYELARRFRAMPHLVATTLVAMSGYGRPSDIQRSYAAGFATHLVKPIDPALLRQLLARIEMPTGESPSLHT